MRGSDHPLARLLRLPFLARFAMAFVAGWGASYALPPVCLYWTMVPAFSMLALLVVGTRGVWGAFGLCWAFAFAFHLFGLSWIGEAFLVDAEQFAWMRPIAIAGLPAGLALIAGLGGVLFVMLRSRNLFQDVVLFATCFTLAEWVRGNILTGFPWNLPVHVWDQVLAVQQGVAWVGPYGLSLITLLAASAPLALAEGNWRRRMLALVLLALPLGLVAVAGESRLNHAPTKSPVVAGVKLRLVQPNIAQKDKWRPEKNDEHLAVHLQLSEGAGAAGVTHIIWPEAATPFLLAESPAALQAIGRITPVGGATIIGTPRRRAAGEASPGAFANSVVTVSSAGTIDATYDKHHLVPFGEYVPLSRWLPIDRIAPGRVGFAAGKGPRSITVPGAPAFSPLVCYEAIFPGEAYDTTDPPSWLLNVTNDAWFGSSAGPHQHLAIARLRSIESGKSLVRVANTGISSVYDAYGRSLGMIPLGTRGYIDVALPRAIDVPVYALYGDWHIIVLLVGMLVVGRLLESKRHRHNVVL
jgi:apolipoprotein N-acyltransferase